jgi:hypothetical protein
MKRVVMILGLVAAAGVGAYGQTKLKTEPKSIYPIQSGIAYQASFCGTANSPFGASFDMLVTEPLAEGWLEVTVGQISKDTGQFNVGAFKARVNQDRLCYVKPIVP